MFDISFSELMLIGIVALVVIGPERLPRVARTVGHLIGRAQRYVSDVKNDIQREVELDELRKMKEEMESAANSIQNSFEKSASSIKQDVQEPLDQLKADFDSAKHSVVGPDLTALDTTDSKASPASTPGTTSTTQGLPSISPDNPNSGPTGTSIPSSVANSPRPDTEQKT